MDARGLILLLLAVLLLYMGVLGNYAQVWQMLTGKGIAWAGTAATAISPQGKSAIQAAGSAQGGPR